ncbi:hypothetical protein [Actinomadura decatromicini]|uniref:hypothetical protein n=1 Tax=Actinomadura decatromicini TaxID=2604572 RepID=UPI001CA325BF|nr:hypothetical protein [Actinomadura decatromicini]
MKLLRRPALGALTAVLLAGVLTVGPQGAASAAGPRVDLKVLVVSDGGASVSAVAGQLAAEGVPYKTVDLRDAGRPKIDAAFLSDTVNGTPRAKYQGVVLPNYAPFQDTAEMTAIADYEVKFGIRQLDAYVYPSAAVGLNTPTYSGILDGTVAEVLPAGRSDAFRYLRGPVRFNDLAPDIDESYGYVSTPLPDNKVAGKTFKPFVNVEIKDKTGTIAGVYTHDGRSEMVLTYSANYEQWQSRTLGHGLISWLTKGVHLGYNRNYLAVHVDDVFMPDARWSTKDNCTPGEDCPSGVTTPDIRMDVDDVVQATMWQQYQKFKLDLAYNAGGTVDWRKDHGLDLLGDSLLAAKAQFRWLNHTYGHKFLGCKQDTSVRPWQCVKDSDGDIEYVDESTIEQEITRNLDWAQENGLSVPKTEVVTGEHSGMKVLPQQPNDNPNLAPALDQTDITWLAGDASRDPAMRSIGQARTIPRHPMSVFFNVGTEQEEVDEYNWIYTKRADGGSGICEDHPDVTTCIKPLSTETGFKSYIVPSDTRITLSHVTGNDPRPHYAHQSNITEDRTLYTLLDNVLGEYRMAFDDNTPVVNDPMASLGAELRRQDLWKAALKNNSNITAYVQDGKVTVSGPDGLSIPVTAPEGTKEGTGGKVFGQAYAGDRSAYVPGGVTLTVPGA